MAILRVTEPLEGRGTDVVGPKASDLLECGDLSPLFERPENVAR